MFIKKIKTNRRKSVSENAMEIIRTFSSDYYLSVDVHPSNIQIFIGTLREKSQDESKVKMNQPENLPF